MAGVVTGNGFILSKAVSVLGTRATSGPNHLGQSTDTKSLNPLMYDYNEPANSHLVHLTKNKNQKGFWVFPT